MINKLLYKEVMVINKYDGGIEYKYKKIKRKWIKKPTFVRLVGKKWDLNKRMWATEYRCIFFTWIKYEVMILGLPYYKVKVKYRIKL